MIMNVGEDASDLVGHAFLCQVIWNDHTMTSGSATSATSVHSAGTLLSLAAGCGVLIALVIASFVIILWVRRRSLTAHNDAVEGFSFRVLKSIIPYTPEQVENLTVRGQYVRGEKLGTPIIGYLEERGVAPQSQTETYACVQLAIDNWRWYGVPFYLRSGKHLKRKGSEINIHFNRAPGVLFNKSQNGTGANVLTLRIQPRESIGLQINAKRPGTATAVTPVQMDFEYHEAFGSYSPEAYERLLLDAILGDSTLFIRRDEVESAWRIIDRIEETWAAGKPPLKFYSPGSWGPDEAEQLLRRTGRSWDELPQEVR